MHCDYGIIDSEVQTASNWHLHFISFRILKWALLEYFLHNIKLYRLINDPDLSYKVPSLVRRRGVGELCLLCRYVHRLYSDVLASCFHLRTFCNRLFKSHSRENKLLCLVWLPLADTLYPCPLSIWPCLSIQYIRNLSFRKCFFHFFSYNVCFEHNHQSNICLLVLILLA